MSCEQIPFKRRTLSPRWSGKRCYIKDILAQTQNGISSISASLALLPSIQSVENNNTLTCALIWLCAIPSVWTILDWLPQSVEISYFLEDAAADCAAGGQAVGKYRLTTGKTGVIL